ncbi:MAG: MinD/ParA family protein [Gammaproteobacteria bacterium]|nr:MinD/ParA family protein [Gammaproteobacteria bacterium]
MPGNFQQMDQAEGLRRLKREQPVRVITVTSGKGGVGKTNVSVNLAMAMIETGKDVMIMDADLGLANVDVMLGLHPRYNLSHVISGEMAMEDIILEGPAGLKMVPAASGTQMMAGLSPTQHAGIIRSFSELHQNLDVLIVDTAAGISDSVVAFSKASQEVIVVVCDEPASITDAYALIKLLNRDHGLNRFRVVANMVASVEQGRDVYEKIARVTDRYLYVEMDYMGAVPFDPALKQAVQKQQPVFSYQPHAPSSEAFRQLVSSTERWPRPRSGGHLEFFAERLLQQNYIEAGAW